MSGFTQNYNVTAVAVQIFEVPTDIARREIRRIIFDDESGAINTCEIIVADSLGAEIFRHNITAQVNSENEHKGTKDNPVMSLRPGSLVSVIGDGVGDLTIEWIDVQ